MDLFESLMKENKKVSKEESKSKRITESLDAQSLILGTLNETIRYKLYILSPEAPLGLPEFFHFGVSAERKLLRIYDNYAIIYTTNGVSHEQLRPENSFQQYVSEEIAGYTYVDAKYNIDLTDTQNIPLNKGYENFSVEDFESEIRQYYLGNHSGAKVSTPLEAVEVNLLHYLRIYGPQILQISGNKISGEISKEKLQDVLKVIESAEASGVFDDVKFIQSNSICQASTGLRSSILVLILNTFTRRFSLYVR